MKEHRNETSVEKSLHTNELIGQPKTATFLQLTYHRYSLYSCNVIIIEVLGIIEVQLTTSDSKKRRCFILWVAVQQFSTTRLSNECALTS